MTGRGEQAAVAMDLARIEAGKLELSTADFALRPLLDEVAGLMAPVGQNQVNSFRFFAEKFSGAGNAAGVLEYCVKRKYLSGNAVASVKDKLLSRYGLGTEKKAQQDSGYKSGLQGILQGDGGQSFNLDAVSDKLKDKGCDYVLDNVGKLI